MIHFITMQVMYSPCYHHPHTHGFTKSEISACSMTFLTPLPCLRNQSLKTPGSNQNLHPYLQLSQPR